MEIGQAWRSNRQAQGGSRLVTPDNQPAKRGKLAETLAVAVCLLVLQIVVFHNHYTGLYVPPWDFWSHYTTDAFAWWTDGSFFHPPNWVPHLWGGYPAAAALQNSAWYLPIGLANAIRPLDLRVIAMVQAFHVAFGALGAYLLIRTAKLGKGPAFLALFAYFFTPAFFGNASHLDIARAFAWAPWVFLCTSPWWPWRRPWAFLVAVVVFWQTIVGAYPGVTVMLAYALIIWIVGLRLAYKGQRNRRDFRSDVLPNDLLPLAVAGLCAVLLSLVKFLPYFLVGASEPNIPIEHTWDLSIFGTIMFPFHYGFISGDITHRSLFVVAPIIPLALCAHRRRITGVATVMLVFYFFVAATNQPWWGAIYLLPAIGLSRFVTTDARVLFGTGLLILACVGLHNLLHGKHLTYPVLRIALIALVPIAGLLVGYVAGFPMVEMALPLALTALSSIIVALALWRKPNPQTNKKPPRNFRIALTASLTALAAISGITWAFENSMAWNENRAVGESGRFGHAVIDLINNRQDLTGINRPARWALPDHGDFPWGMASMITGNAAQYAGQIAVGGYVNITRTAAWQAIFPSVNGHTQEAVNARAFWAAPGRLFQIDQNLTTPNATEIERCDHAFQCGENIVTQTPIWFDPSGRWEYQIETNADIIIGANEAYYPGFTIQATSRNQVLEHGVLNIEPEMAPGGFLAFRLPQGDWDINITYQTPGMAISWVLWWLGAGIALGFTGFTIVRYNRNDGKLWYRRAA